MEKTITESKRNILKHAEEGHFCRCGKPSDVSCTDAQQIIIGDSIIWRETAPRYGCFSHPVESRIYFADGESITAREYENVGQLSLRGVR